MTVKSPATRDEWFELSKTLTLHGQSYINGQFCDAESGETFASINPATEEHLTDVASCDQADVDKAVANGLAAYRSGEWAEASPKHRKKVLLKLAALVEQHKDEFAVLDTLDMGKSISEMTAIDVPDAIDCIQWTAESIDKVYGEIAPTAPGSLALISREPVGVVACITPWNYPLMMVSWKIAPALAAGNSVVLKPSEKTSLSALRLAQLATEAG
ncbi:MAG: aldehyde dehydrogenase family protein, partial [Oceanospirillum sp.]|nr:aldehyde dehydrogenase family protein [Oceanospirillum sp.]